jgi:hypothetical protein
MDINEKDNKKYIYTALGFSSTFCITEFVVDIVILMILMFLSFNLYTNYTRSVDIIAFNSETIVECTFNRFRLCWKCPRKTITIPEKKSVNPDCCCADCFVDPTDVSMLTNGYSFN